MYTIFAGINRRAVVEILLRVPVHQLFFILFIFVLLSNYALICLHFDESITRLSYVNMCDDYSAIVLSQINKN